jgi:hypothetical protein
MAGYSEPYSMATQSSNSNNAKPESESRAQNALNLKLPDGAATKARSDFKLYFNKAA